MNNDYDMFNLKLSVATADNPSNSLWIDYWNKHRWWFCSPYTPSKAEFTMGDWCCDKSYLYNPYVINYDVMLEHRHEAENNDYKNNEIVLDNSKHNNLDDFLNQFKRGDNV